MAELHENAGADCRQEIQPVFAGALERRGLDVLEVDVADALTMSTSEVHGVAAAVSHVACVEAQPDELRIGLGAQPLHFRCRFHCRPGMVVKGYAQALVPYTAREVIEVGGQVAPLVVVQPILVGHTAGEGVAFGRALLRH